MSWLLPPNWPDLLGTEDRKPWENAMGTYPSPMDAEYRRMRDQTYAGPTKTPIPDKINDYDRVAVRMGWEPRRKFPFDAYFIHRTADAVHTFVARGTNVSTFSDDPGLYPSDGFITRLRLWMDGTSPDK